VPCIGSPAHVDHAKECRGWCVYVLTRVQRQGLFRAHPQAAARSPVCWGVPNALLCTQHLSCCSASSKPVIIWCSKHQMPPTPVSQVLQRDKEREAGLMLP
jgi:hypothetical protein